MKLLLLLNMGGPNNLDEVEIFLKNMFNDPCILRVKSNFTRKILATLITKMRLKYAKQNYEQIGGKSPLASITKSLCDKISALCDEFAVDFAMNYTPPFTKDVLKKYQNLSEIIVFPLYPHHSITTVTSSLNDFYKVYNELNLGAKIRIIEPFFESKIYNEMIINDIKSKVENTDISDISMVFSAHSLPQKIIDKGDIYEKHVVSHVEILSNTLKENELNFRDIKLAYQSRLGPVKWLEPSLNSVLASLENKKALIYPLSFCIDNSESIFELAVEYKHVASELGFSYYDVVACPNDSDGFANFILNLAKE